jgi:molybdopterin converting factor small subunit
VSQLRATVVARVPSLQKIVTHSLWAIGTEYVSDNDKLTESSDVALIPPVSGG